MKKIVVIGSLNVDYVLQVDHMPALGETLLSQKFSIIPGGKGANQAFALGSMGADVAMLGAVGQDDNGSVELASLAGVGVDVSRIKKSSEAATGMAIIPVNAEGENSIIVVQGANALVTPAYIDSCKDMLEAADFVLLQLEIPLETVVHAATLAKSLGKTVILDPAPAPDALPDALLRCVDYLKPNEIELAMLTGIEDHLEEACDALLDRGVGCVLASLGSEGAFVRSREGLSRSFPAPKVKAVDTTAAGDTFTAAVAYALARNSGIEKAIPFAAKAAALAVQRWGAQSSVPNGEESRALWAEVME